MKTLLSEIKKFRSFVKLNEDFSDVRIALIGDSLVYYLKDNELQEIPPNGLQEISNNWL